ncbi:MAG: dTDP-4-dehydrorhamnose 3,5-epimerase family protein [Planctomycetota bacterium]
MTNRLRPEEIHSRYRDQISTQDYTPRERIEGVKIVELRRFVEDGGSFCELARFDEKGELIGLPGFRPSQVNASEMLPGTIKAFHLHYNQEDAWFVSPSQRLLVGLKDLREDSPTKDVEMRFVLGDGRAQLLYIPRGVLHGVANVWPQSATILYFVNQFFDAKDPDERRLPWDLMGADFWEIQKG